MRISTRATRHFFAPTGAHSTASDFWSPAAQFRGTAILIYKKRTLEARAHVPSPPAPSRTCIRTVVFWTRRGDGVQLRPPRLACIGPLPGRVALTARKGWRHCLQKGQQGDVKQSKLKGPNEPTWTPCRPWHLNHRRPRSSPRRSPVPARWASTTPRASWPPAP
jgi:hypothetical protein